MLFSDLHKLAEIAADPSNHDLAVAILTDLFQQASFGEAGLLLALCQPKPAWQIHPWLEPSVPADLLIKDYLPEPHTLQRVFTEMQRGAKNEIARHMLLANLDSSSAAIAKQLLDGKGFVEVRVLETALAGTTWRAGLPILPEKLVRRTSQEIAQVWQSLGPGYGHVKDDGFYCQLHKWGEQVLIFVGANLLEQTNKYPRVIEAVQHQVKSESAVLEGELVGLDPTTGQVLRRRYLRGAVQHQVRLFDLLAAHGADWRERPYTARRDKRLSLVTDQPSGVLRHASEFEIKSVEELFLLSEQCWAEAREGLVIKQIDSRYQSGLRNPACVKLKQVEPVDATIIGYFLSPQGEVESFLLALYNEQTAQFEACGRSRGGLSPQERQAIMALLEPYAGYEPDQSIVVEEPPDVWVKPVFVFELLADNRHPSSRYPCARMQTGQGWALHNPVFQSAEPRLDKHAHHTTPISQFLRLREEAGRAPGEPEIAQPRQSMAQQIGLAWDLPSPNSGE